MKFRYHRGSLDESMKTLVEVRDKTALAKHLGVPRRSVKITPHGGPDFRIGWKATFLVTIKSVIIGVTDSNVDDYGAIEEKLKGVNAKTIIIDDPMKDEI